MFNYGVKSISSSATITYSVSYSTLCGFIVVSHTGYYAPNVGTRKTTSFVVTVSTSMNIDWLAGGV